MNLDEKFAKILELNAEYKETKNFSLRQEANKIWNTMNPDERRFCHNNCVYHNQRTSKRCYWCDVLSAFEKRTDNPQFTGGPTRPAVFRVPLEVYTKRRSRAVPCGAPITPYNKQKLSKNGIWYTCKEVDGKYQLCVMRKDLERLEIRTRASNATLVVI